MKQGIESRPYGVANGRWTGDDQRGNYFMLRAYVFSAAFSVGILSSTGCRATERVSAPDRQQTVELPGLAHLYAKATSPHRRDVRKPVRDERDRAMRLLAAKVETLAKETQTWDSDARLAGIIEPDRDHIRIAVDGFRQSLHDLKAAADQSDVTAVRSRYAQAMTDYRHVLEVQATQQ